MKKFIRKLAVSPLGVLLRNITGVHRPLFFFQDKTTCISSDLFVWQIDKEQSTRIVISDILEKYYGLKSYCRFVFYDENGAFIREFSRDFTDGFCELIIDEAFMGRVGMGTFSAFNLPADNTVIDLNVTNRCYVGYGRDKCYSMVHGNMIGAMITNLPDGKDELIHDRIEMAVNPAKGNYSYLLQKRFDVTVDNALLFSNPLTREITVKIQGKQRVIPAKGCAKIDLVFEGAAQPVEIQSDFIFPRPVVFAKKNGFEDYHHA